MPFALRHLTLVPLLAFAACNAETKSDLPPQPPIWVVSDADSEITLYPTLHLLPPEIEWQSAEMTRRLSEAEEVWFEIMPGSENDPALQGAMMQLGLEAGSSLASKLNEEEVAALKDAGESLGMPFQIMDQMRPWLASTLVSAGALVDSGFDPESGVEKKLAAMTTGKKVRALETPSQQMEMLSSIPEDLQFEMLREALGEMDEGVAMLKKVASDWSVGDVEDLEDELIDEMKSEMPAAYDVIFTNRNASWADQIEIEMKGSGTDFIAVGAGHLVGDDSVPAMLKARGYTVERL